MKVGLVQFNPKVGDIPGNKKRILEWIEKGKKEGCDLLLFPELSTTGYPPRDLLDYPNVIDANLEAVKEIQKATSGIAVVLGFVERNPKPYIKPYLNAAAILEDGKKVGVYYKQLLPYYDIFEEERYFDWGTENGVFNILGKKIGLTICEDAWNEPGFLKRPYQHHPIEPLKNLGLDLLINISASPFNVGKPEIRVKLFQIIAKKVGAPILFCNQSGANDEIVFDGSSFVMAKDGSLLSTATPFKEELVTYEWDSKATLKPWPKEKIEWIHEALVIGIRDYVKKSGAKGVCLGLSGGIDSSVVAALAAQAVGKENVTALALPTRFTSSASNEDAKKLAQNLNIEFISFPIETIFEKFAESLKSGFGKTPHSKTLENTQPRIRMTVLMAYSNETGKLLLNTSNKSEIATGFATLYGDSSGALSVLGDLTKHEVYELADFINRSNEIIPKRVIERAPTAELRENQTDQDELPPYDELDQMVVEMIEKNHVPRQSETFNRLHALSEYKRRQLPPALRVSAHAFGMGRRIPVVSTKPSEIKP